MVQELAADGIDVVVACRVLKLSRSRYYEWCAGSRSTRVEENELVLKNIQQIHAEWDGAAGQPKRGERLMRYRTACGSATLRSTSPREEKKTLLRSGHGLLLPHEIIGWSIAGNMHTELVTEALGMAILHLHLESQESILHSGHGSQ